MTVIIRILYLLRYTETVIIPYTLIQATPIIHVRQYGVLLRRGLMGGFLTKPVTDKTVTDGVLTVCARECLYCTASMQGWREDMEVINNYDNNRSQATPTL